MIPARNLMEGCGLKHHQQSKWIAVITEMMNVGPRVILRLGEFRKALIAYPEPLMWYSKMRTELEMLSLELMVRKRLFFVENILGSAYNNGQADIMNTLQTCVMRSFSMSDSISDELLVRVSSIILTIALSLSDFDLRLLGQLMCRLLG
ncbi:hypothetical protein DPMN_066608 [Dreissena polymorpha]|uniref:Uncharacterized protein n=1 Tax=Dreissena polymorpha TaxID=45954 RepID=A0A9D4BSY4_DREPO|nr:hypothetical protein DPMN_066608 [Dreissena polymorpha]